MVRPVEVDTADSFHREVLAEPSRPVVVYFWSSTCPACAMLSPQLDAAGEHCVTVKFTKVALQEAPELFKQYGIRATPTLVVFKAGEEVGRRADFREAEDIIHWVNEHV